MTLTEKKTLFSITFLKSCQGHFSLRFLLASSFFSYMWSYSGQSWPPVDRFGLVIWSPRPKTSSHCPPSSSHVPLATGCSINHSCEQQAWKTSCIIQHGWGIAQRVSQRHTEEMYTVCTRGCCEWESALSPQKNNSYFKGSSQYKHYYHQLLHLLLLWSLLLLLLRLLMLQ